MIKNKRSNKKGTKLLCFSDYDIFYYYDSCFKCTGKLMNSLEPDTLRDHQARTVYLVTYSQVDLEKVGNRKALADIVTVALIKISYLTVWNTVLKRDTGKGSPLPTDT